MERRILSVLQRMQELLNENQLRELKTVLQMMFHDCELVQKTEVMVVDNSWRGDSESVRWCRRHIRIVSEGLR